MKNTVIYALDFDGVLCDSAIETGITGWKAATHIWPDMKADLPASDMIERFRLLRPVIETGYEAILVMRLLFLGHDLDDIFADFSEKTQQLIEQSGNDIALLKQLFGQTRETWIDNNSRQWLEMNPLFSGVVDKLNQLDRQNWYIVTTKQQRFVASILAANQIPIAEERIFGLERNKSKVEILLELLNKHPEHEIHFVEDRLPTLLNVLKNPDLNDIKLFFANWGYNTEQDKRIAGQQAAIQCLALEIFLEH